jgi:DNA repair ATPase RecN
MNRRKPLRLIWLRVNHFLGLIAAEFEPADGPMTVIGGANGAGKTAVLEAVAALLNAKSPPDPIHHGASQSIVEGRLSNGLQMKRVYRKNTSPKLELRMQGKSGTLSSPVAALEALHGMSYDPLEFDRMKPAKRGEKLKKLMGFDWSALDAQVKDLGEQRTEVGREARALEGQLKGMDPCEDAPAEPVSVEGLMRQLGELQEADRQLDEQERQAAAAHDAAQAAERGHAELLSELELELERLQREVQECQAELEQARSEAPAKLEAAAEAQEELTRLSEVKRSDDEQTALREQILQVGTINERVSARKLYVVRDQELTAKLTKYEHLTAKIEDCRTKKAQQLAEAQFPVPGLGFDEHGGVTLVSAEGQPVPWEQANMAQRITASVAIGAAGNPELPLMIVRDGSLLRRETLQILAECLEKHGAHAFIEDARATDEEADIVIEAGRVKGAG